MEAIQQARKLYINYRSLKLFPKEQEKSQMKNNIQQLITIAIRELPSNVLFENVWMLEVLKSALTQNIHEDLDVRAVERAFKGLEKYFLNLVQQPWKEEFKEIKMYGGFYKTRVKSVIPGCEHIFERAGYIVMPEKSTMVYRGPLNKDFLLLLAFDCRVGQIECIVIAEDYSRTKHMPLALSNVLNDGYYLDKFAFRHSLAQKRGLAEETLVNFNASAPPAIPKRQPIIASSTLRQNVKIESEVHNPSDDQKLDLGEIRWKPGVSFPQNPPQFSTDLRTFYLPKAPVSSGVRSESLAYIDSMRYAERIPDLPQGTLEDHMLETLKLVNRPDLRRHQVSEDWKQRDSKNNTGLDQSHCLIAPFLAARGANSGTTMQKNLQPASIFDEGIDLDLSTSKSFSVSSKFDSAGAQQVLPTKHAFNNNQASFTDPGYGTRNPTSNYSQFSQSLLYNIPQTIYHPPSTQPVMSGKATLSRQNAIPCQIPSRTLKTSQNSEFESVNSQMYSASALSYTTPQLSSIESQIKSGTYLVQPTKSVPGYLPQPRPVAMEQMSKQHPTIYKSSSLKTDSTLLSKPVLPSRMARSMDMTTFWECPSCSKLNTYPDTICSACSQIYIDADVHWHEFNKTQTMF